MEGGGLGVGQIPLVCAGPVRYVGQELVRMDLDNLKAACQAAGVEEAFVPATAPGTIALQRPNEYYASDDEYLYAIADAMAVEYKMVVDAGFILQIDDPRMVTAYDSMDPPPSAAEYQKFAMHRVEALNHALKGLPGGACATTSAGVAGTAPTRPTSSSRTSSTSSSRSTPAATPSRPRTRVTATNTTSGRPRSCPTASC